MSTGGGNTSSKLMEKAVAGRLVGTVQDDPKTQRFTGSMDTRDLDALPVDGGLPDGFLR